LIAKQGQDMAETIKAICSIVKGPVSAEVTATDYATMLKEGEYLASLAKNVAVKVPLTINGLKTCKSLREKGTMVNVTLCFSAAQALLAAKAGATFISPFVGRLDDIGEKGMDLIEDIVDMYDNYGFDTQVLVASIRTKQHLIDAAVIGAHVSTIPPKVVYELYEHPLTDKGLKAFLDDWAKTGQSILKD
jgi:transaldolase